MNKRMIVSLGILLVIIAGAVISYKALAQPQPEEVYNSYLKKTAESTSYSSIDTYSGTGSDMKLQGTISAKDKGILITGNYKCTGKLDGTDVSIDATANIENANYLVKLNSFSGEVTVNGNRINLNEYFTPILGKWYSTGDNPALQAMMDSGVYVFNDVVIAPSYSSEKIVDVFNKHKVFTINTSEKIDGNYVINITAKKDAYSDALKEVFPNLSKTDLVLDNVFEKKNTKDFTITLKKDGTLVSEKLTSTNSCKDLLTTYVSNNVVNVPEDLSGTSTPQLPTSQNIIKATNAQPISEMSKALGQ